MMRVETLDRVPDGAEEIASRSSRATFYQTGTWLNCLIKCFPDWTFRCLVARNGRELSGYLPFFVMKRSILRTCCSLPFGTYGGAVSDGSDAHEDTLLEKFLDLRRGTGIHQLILVDYAHRAGDPGLEVTQETAHVVDLSGGFDSVWGGFERSKRRQTRKGAREGIEVAEAKSPEEIAEYYEIYKQRITQWNQRAYPKSLFVELLSSKTERVRLFVARANGAMLGGHVNFYFKDTVTAWNGVTKMDRLSPQASTVLYSTCIRDACERNYKRYNLGGSLHKESLIDYKEALGGVPHRYAVYRWRSMRAKIAAALRRSLRPTGE